MGENARVDWEWHNNEIGRGYQAKGVIRQPGQLNTSIVNIIDKTKLVNIKSDKNTNNDDDSSDTNHIHHKKHKKNIKKSKNSKDKKKDKRKDKKKDKKKEKDKSNTNDLQDFNPILQFFASRISDSTREFT
eukprot:gene20609-26721_t